MCSQNEFSVILDKVKLLVLNAIEIYDDCNFEILVNTDDLYRVIIEFNSCIGELIVNKPEFAPYRYVKFEVLSSIEKEIRYIYAWYDSEQEHIEGILTHIQEGLKIANEYR